MVVLHAFEHCKKLRSRRLDRAGIRVNKNGTSLWGIFSFLGAISYKVCTERVCGFGLLSIEARRSKRKVAAEQGTGL